MAESNDPGVFFVDDDLIERLMRGDAAPKPDAKTRDAASKTLGKAVALAEQGRVDDAVRELESAARRGENPVEVQSALGHLHVEKKEWPQAQESYAKVVEADPKDRTAHYNLALTLDQQGKTEESAQEFAAAVTVDPGQWRAQLGEGLALLKLKRSEEALERFEAALKNSSDERVLFGMAVALHQLGRLDDAAEIYGTLLTADSIWPELLANLIAVATARQDDAKVRELSERLLKIKPQSRAALEGIVTSALSRGDYSAAVQFGSKLVKVATDSYEAWFNLGLAQQKTGRLEPAAAAYREAVRIRPSAAEANANLGAALQELGDLVGARQAYERAEPGSQGLPGAIWNFALVAEREGKVSEAEERFAKLVALKPDWEDAGFRLGYLLLQRGDYTNAIDRFELCLRKRPEWVEALVNLGLAHWKLRHLDAASSTFGKVLSLDPANREGLQALCAIAIERKDGARALELHRKFAAGGGRSAPLSYNAGLLLQSSGDFAGAVECYQAASSSKPDFAEALLNLGHVLKAAGKENEARDAWAKAMAADPGLADRYFQ